MASMLRIDLVSLIVPAGLSDTSDNAEAPDDLFASDNNLEECDDNGKHPALRMVSQRGWRTLPMMGSTTRSALA